VAQEKLSRGLRLLEMQFDRIHLVRQLLIYQETTGNEQGAMSANWLVLQLMKKLNGNEIIEAMEPLLIHRSAHVRRASEQTLGTLCLGEQPVEFVGVTQLIGEGNEAIAQHPNLIRWMFATEPGNALLAFARTGPLNRDQSREVLLAEHVISDVVWLNEHNFKIDSVTLANAKAELNRLCESEHWWARLYVAEIVWRHPELRTETLQERLRTDENELVRAVGTKEPTR
jgi:hypothetical protein